MCGFQFLEFPITTRLAGKFGKMIPTRIESAQDGVVNALSDLTFHEKAFSKQIALGFINMDTTYYMIIWSSNADPVFIYLASLVS